MVIIQPLPWPQFLIAFYSLPGTSTHMLSFGPHSEVRGGTGEHQNYWYPCYATEENEVQVTPRQKKGGEGEDWEYPFTLSPSAPSSLSFLFPMGLLCTLCHLSFPLPLYRL